MRLQAALCPALCRMLPAPAPTEKPQTCLLRLPILLATFKCSSAEFERHRGQEPGQSGGGRGGSAAEKWRPLQVTGHLVGLLAHSSIPLFPAALLVPRHSCRPANPQRERARRTAGYPATVYCGRQCGPPRPPQASTQNAATHTLQFLSSIDVRTNSSAKEWGGAHTCSLK